MKDTGGKIRRWLGGLTVRTGVIVACVCAGCYAVSFLQFLLPLSVKTKGILWVVFFGLAKSCQYSAIAILGKEGWRRLRGRLRW